MSDNNYNNVSRKNNYGRCFKLMVIHSVLFAIALFLSFVVSHSMEVSEKWFPNQYFSWLAVILSVKLLIFGIFGQYSGWWRYASVSDLIGIIKASHACVLILIPGWYIFRMITGQPDFETMPRFLFYLFSIEVSVLFMDWAATILIICVARISIRLYYEENRTLGPGRLQRMLIVGAGNAGETLLREIQRMSKMQYEVVGFIDDNPKKVGAKIHGVAVLGDTSQIRDIASKQSVDEIVIAMPSASHKQIRRVIEQCRGANLKFSIVPDLVSIAAGRVNVSQMREVDINDLLGRDPIKLDMQGISKFLNNKVILITGAGGSIGSEMCKQVASFGPKRLILIEQAENPLFFIDRELRHNFADLDCKPHICDISDAERVDHIFSRYKPEIVIHAAAHKHVPLMETDPGEAIKNNVVGTRTIAYASDKYGASHFVMISTDKAVNPTSIMGSSKRLAEMSIQCLDKRSKTVFTTVRFGNVLGSNGSVIPIFREQIRRGGPVTVTHPEMTRYFMTIPEASQLVLQAATMGKGGEIFVLDMGEPVKIVDLARDLITLSGFRPNEDIEINFSGMRPGEKLFEELSIDGEDMAPTCHKKIGIWHNVPADEKTLDETVTHLQKIVNESDYQKIVVMIKKVIPEYVGDIDCMALHKAHQEKRENGNTAFNSPAIN